MSWRDLLQADEDLVAPWLGGHVLVTGGRRFELVGKRPAEHGWQRFTVSGGRKATWAGPAEPALDPDWPVVRGYLIGDRLVPDGASVTPDVERWIGQTEVVHLVEPGLDRYTRIAAARLPSGQLVYVAQEWPLGPEDRVRAAFLDESPSVDDVPAVSPALDLAFRVDTWQRELVRRRRAELEAAEQLRAELARDDGRGRRRLARQDFAEAARRALALPGAVLLDQRPAFQSGEHVVRFRFRQRRFECVCDDDLRIVDAGICLNDYETGAKGDTLFTLESLPAVIGEAMDEGVLVVFRHVEGL